MKRLIMLALVLTTIATSALANVNDAVNQKVISAFTRDFATAKNVKWTEAKELYRARFEYNGQVLFAYYNEQGEQLAVSRNITIAQLPLQLASKFEEMSGNAYLTEMFEVSANGGTSYYATIKSDTHTIILKAEGPATWIVFKKEKIRS